MKSLTYQILIVEDHKLVAEGLKNLLDEKYNRNVCTIAQNGREALTLISKSQPNLLLLDLNMPDIDGIELLEIIKTRFPIIKVIVLTMYRSKGILKKVMEHDIDGYVLKFSSGEEVLKAIQYVLGGNQYFSNSLNLSNKNEKLFKDKFDIKYQLTSRESEILELIALSYTNKAISKKLHISEETVKTHRRNLKRKIKAENTADLVRFALENK